MDKYILQEEQPEKRLRYLESTADAVVKEKYYQRLTSDELATKKAEYTANALSLEDMEEQKKEMIEQFKDSMKPLKEGNKILSSEIRTGFIQREGKLFQMVDRTTRMVYYYDETGEMIETKTRPANADEIHKQLTISVDFKTGTNN